MGITVGPDGKIWYVNATTNQVVRLEFIDVTGVNEMDAENNTHVYPNPNNGNFYLETTSSLNENSTIAVYNMIGQQVNVIVNKTAVGLYQIDLSNEANGTYYVKLISAKNTIVKKIVIAK